jgi:DNA-binding NarL/FixJ family response regulator
VSITAVPFPDVDVAVAANVLDQALAQLPMRTRRCDRCGFEVKPITAETLESFPADLSARERRAIVLLCGGRSNKEIAARMDTSEQVVKNLLRFVFEKVGCHDRISLVVRMMRFKYEGE